MKIPYLITPGGNAKPLWGHCDSCNAKFPSKEMAEMQEDFLQHLAKVHGEIGGTRQRPFSLTSYQFNQA